MRKFNLLGTAALCTMLMSSSVYAAENFDDVPEEEVAQAIVSVLKKNPKIAYDALMEFRQATEEQKAQYKEDYSPLEKKIAAVLKDNPLLVVGALQIYDQEQQQQELLKTAQSYQAYLDEINKAEIFAGNENGKYTLVEFFDFSCGYCKQMAPRIKNIIEKNSDVKVIFKPVSFLSPNSELAAKAAVAAYNQGKFLEMYGKIMSEVRINENALEKIAQDLGLDMERYKKDYSSAETKALLDSFKSTADKIQIKSVPTLILEGMPLYAVEETQLQHAIDVLRLSDAQ